MSRHQSIHRRLSLIAGTSLSAASLALAGSLGVVLTPTLALAANECAAGAAAGTGATPDSNGGDTADTYVCPPATYSGGITYVTDGNLDVTVQTVSSFGTGGVKLTAGTDADDLNDSITLRKTGTASLTLNGNGFPIAFDIDTQSGDIVVDFAQGNIFANNGATTHNIQAISHNGGDVSITTRGNIAATGNTTTQTGGTAGIEARSLGGGDVTVLTGVGGTSGAVTGRLYGVLAETTGAGALTVTAPSVNANAIQGVAGIYAKTGTGLLTITTAASGGAGTGALIEAGGDVVFSGGFSGAQYGLNLTNVAGATSTINVTSDTALGGLAAIRAQGGGVVDVNVSGRLAGALDFAGLSTAPTVDILSGGQWRVASTMTVSSTAGVLINNASTGNDLTDSSGRYGGIATGARSSLTAVDADTVVTFTGLNDRIVNTGLFVVNADPDNGTVTGKNRGAFEAETRFVGLESFEHSGAILLGGFADRTNIYGTGIDSAYDDILSMPGVTFVGQDGVIVFDVNLLARGGQAACDAALRDADGNMPVADCIALVGGETQGTTRLRIMDLFQGDRGAYNPDGAVLVDVSGGTSAAGHFVIDPASANYNPEQGGVIDKGVFFYGLVYDADTQRHKLVGLPGGSALQFPLLTQAATALWRTSTGTWLERQADLRGDIDEGVGGGVWLRVSTELADRDVMQTVEGGGGSFTFDNTHQQTSYAVTGGADLLTGVGADSAWALGVMAGYAHADIEYDSSPNTGRLDGWTGGLYGSFISGGLFVDAAVNANKATVDDDVPSLSLFPAGTILSTHLLSVGGQVEAGWRLPLMDTLFVEPLAGVSYVKTKYDDMRVPSDDPTRPGIDLEFDDPVSLRAGVGGRLGLDQDYGGVRAQYSVLGRVWNEFEGESQVTLGNVGADALVMDEFSGRFTELGFGASLYSGNGAVSGFLNIGGKFADDYQAQTGSAGVRVNW